MVIASSFSVRHICFYEWEPDHCAEDSRRRSYDITSVSQMETSRRPFGAYLLPKISQGKIEECYFMFGHATPSTVTEITVIIVEDNL